MKAPSSACAVCSDRSRDALRKPPRFCATEGPARAWADFIVHNFARRRLSPVRASSPSRRLILRGPLRRTTDRAFRTIVVRAMSDATRPLLSFKPRFNRSQPRMSFSAAPPTSLLGPRLASQTPEHQSALLKLFSRIGQLSSLPGVAQRVLKVANDGEAGVRRPAAGIRRAALRSSSLR